MCLVAFPLQLSMVLLQSVVRSHLGVDVPNVYDLTRNVSFILQNGHSSVSYSRPLLPNVAEIACIHCKPARPLPKVCNTYIERHSSVQQIHMISITSTLFVHVDFFIAITFYARTPEKRII